AGSATTACRARTSRAILPKAAALRRALIDSTRYRSGSRLSRSIVLAPIEPVAPRMVIPRTPVAGLASDRTALTAVMYSPYQQPPCGCSVAATQQSHHTPRKCRSPEPVEPIHHAAMTGNNLACILGIELTLDPGFEEVAELRSNRQKQRKERNRKLVEQPELCGNDNRDQDSGERTGDGT